MSMNVRNMTMQREIIAMCRATRSPNGITSSFEITMTATFHFVLKTAFLRAYTEHFETVKTDAACPLSTHVLNRLVGCPHSLGRLSGIF
jgi:hypothetical protein